MSEYVQLCRILDRAFLSPSQEWMIESKSTTHKPQKIQLEKTGRRNIACALYRFDLKNKEFLQFFNKSDDAPNNP